jgi:putative phosphoribosyl transferase
MVLLTFLGGVMNPSIQEHVKPWISTFSRGLILPKAFWGAVAFASGVGTGVCQGIKVVESLHDGGLAVLVVPPMPSLQASLTIALDCLALHPLTAGLPLGLAGLGAGAARAMQAAMKEQGRVKAMALIQGGAAVAEEALENLEIPSLFVVDASDNLDVELHDAVAASLRCPSKVALARDASQPGDFSLSWFQRHFLASGPPVPRPELLPVLAHA